MRKSDIETHREGYGYTSTPAINVKVNRLGIRAHEVAAHFECSDEQAERALQFAFDSEARIFWEDAESVAKEIFGAHVEVYSEGRSGGWLIVKGLPDLETWDAIMVGKWARLAKHCREDIAYRTGREALLEGIEANQWYKEGSEAYNFVDTKDGKTECVADMKAKAKELGFGPVVRA